MQFSSTRHLECSHHWNMIRLRFHWLYRALRVQNRHISFLSFRSIYLTEKSIADSSKSFRDQSSYSRRMMTLSEFDRFGTHLATCVCCDWLIMFLQVITLVTASCNWVSFAVHWDIGRTRTCLIISWCICVWCPRRVGCFSPEWKLMPQLTVGVVGYYRKQPARHRPSKSTDSHRHKMCPNKT